MGIASLLDPEDWCVSPPRYDDKSVITYVSQLLKYSTSEKKLLDDVQEEFLKL